MKPICTLKKISILAFFMVGLAACSGKQNIRPPSPLPELKKAESIEKLWSENATSGLGKYYLQLRPYHALGKIFVVDNTGNLSARELDGGAQVWTQKLETAVTAGVNGGEGIVVVGAESGQVSAFSSADGTPLWSQSLSSQVTAISRASEGMLVARTGDGYMFGLSVSDGKTQWKQLRKTPALSLHTQSEPLVARGVAFVGLDSGKLLMISLTDGRVLWEKTIALGRGRTELDRMVDIDGQLALSDGVVYVSSYQGKLVAIDAARGQVLWQEDISSVTGLAVDSQALYVTDENSVLWARDKRSGAALWKQDKLKFRKITAPAVDGQRVAVGDLEGYVHWLDSETGRLVGRQRADKAGVLSPPVEIDGSLVVLGESGQLSRWKSQ